MRTRCFLAALLVLFALLPRAAAAQVCPAPTLSLLPRDQRAAVWQPGPNDFDYLSVRGSGAAWRFQGGTVAGCWRTRAFPERVRTR